MLKYKFLIIVFATLIISPAFGQQMPNDSLSIAKFDIPWNEFNLPARDSVIVPFDEIHETVFFDSAHITDFWYKIYCKKICQEINDWSAITV